MSNTLYTCLLEENDPQQPFVQVYWGYAERVGIALENMRAAALVNGFRHCLWTQVDPYDLANLETEVEYSGDRSVFWAKGRVFFEPGGPTSLVLPHGVIPSCIEGEFDPGDIQPGYEVFKRDGLFFFELNVCGERLESDYQRFLESFQPFKVFWYKLHSHWENVDEDLLYVNEALDSATAIQKHLAANRHNSLLNGFVTLTAFNPEGATNLSITDHRKLVVVTHSEQMLERAEFNARRLGYSALDPFITIDRRIHHWHFRGSLSLSRNELVEHIKTLGFSRWEPIRLKDGPLTLRVNG